jgi:hypothetical protein
MDAGPVWCVWREWEWNVWSDGAESFSRPWDRPGCNEAPQLSLRLISLRMICRLPNCGPAIVEVRLMPFQALSLCLDPGDDPTTDGVLV